MVEIPLNIKYFIHFSSHCCLCKKHITSITLYSALVPSPVLHRFIAYSELIPLYLRQI